MTVGWRRVWKEGMDEQWTNHIKNESPTAILKVNKKE